MSAPSTTLAPGAWGGEQVMLTVGADKALLRLGCAEGELPTPIRLDAGGHFAVDGPFTAHGGGPSTPDEKALRARYEGVLTGDRLTLTVRHGKATDTYVLNQGLQAKVIRCL